MQGDEIWHLQLFRGGLTWSVLGVKGVQGHPVNITQFMVYRLCIVSDPNDLACELDVKISIVKVEGLMLAMVRWYNFNVKLSFSFM